MKTLAYLMLSLLIPFTAFSVGSGGLLVHTPYAKAYLNGEELECKIYIHPTEGSVLVIPDSASVAYGLDKAKNHSITIPRAVVEKTEWPGVINVPEESPYTVIQEKPIFITMEPAAVFTTVFDDGTLLTIIVAYSK